MPTSTGITSRAWYQPNANGGGAANSNLPDWIKAAIANIGTIGPGAASQVTSSGPQQFSALQDIFKQSLGQAQSQLDPNSIKSVFGDSIGAAMKLGGEQINSAEGERGAAVRPGGVAEQKMMDLGLRVQQPLTEALLGNMNTGLQFNQNALGALFSAASGPQANSVGYRNTIQDINSQLPPYVQQPNSSAGGAGGSGGSSKGSGGGGGNSTPGGSGHYTGFDGYKTNDPGLGGGSGYGSAPSMGSPDPGFNIENPWGYNPQDPNAGFGGMEGPGTTDPNGGSGGLGGIYDDANQPGGAAAPEADNYNYFEIYGPERKGRAVSKSAYEASRGAYDFYKLAK